ncbi:MAG: leucine-rich repeat protein [Tannerellaceae bacterium]|jgi:hypothetical protein|nr:leucine-rich repeat protein [Tannerellaceae bacterium]
MKHVEQKQSQAGNSNTNMETDTIQKNGAGLKSRYTRSRANILLLGILLLIFCAFTNKTMGQTWQIGIPNAESISAVLNNGTLTITGTGAMQNWTDQAPWHSVKDNITSVIINEGITTIGNSAFYFCGNLNSVSLPNSLITIGEYAFSDCLNLTSITIPSNVTSIANYAFQITALREIRIESQNPPSVGHACFWAVNVSTCKLYVPEGAQRAYAATNEWAFFDIIGCDDDCYNILVRESKHIRLEFRQQLLSITNEQLAAWLSNLDRMYEQYVDLMSGLTPFEGKKMVIRTIGGIPAWAYAGYPIQWNANYVSETLTAFADIGDWSFGIMHEMGHNFATHIGGFGSGTMSYNWSEEVFANMRMYLALTKTNGKAYINDRTYVGAEIAEYYKSDYDRKVGNQEPLNSDGLQWTLIRLGNHYQKDGDHGYWLYKQAFSIINNSPNNPNENNWSGWHKFNHFLDILSSCAGRDVRETYSAEELSLIKSALGDTEDETARAELQLIALAAMDSLYQNQTATFTATLKNNGTATYNSHLWVYLEKIHVYTPNISFDAGIVSIAPGETKTITVSGKIALPPDYYACNMIQDANNDPSNMSAVQFDGTVLGVILRVKEGRPELQLVALAAKDSLYQNEAASFTATLKNNGTATYNSHLWVYLEKILVYTPNISFDAGIVSIAPGETKTITVSGKIALPPDYYACNMIQDANNDPSNMSTVQFDGTVLGIILRVKVGRPELQLIALTAKDSLYQNQTAGFTAKLKNNGTATYNSHLWVYLEKILVYTPSQMIDAGIVSIAPGETRTIIVSGKITLPPDLYACNMIQDANNDSLNMATVQFDGTILGVILTVHASVPAQTWKIGFPDAADVTATLYNDTLTIAGTGATDNLSSERYPPWYNIREKIKDVTIKNGVTRIGDGLFRYCNNLKSVSIPNSVTAIGQMSFTEAGITTITIPSSVTNIGSLCFAGCPLTEIHSGNSTPPSLGSDCFGSVDRYTCKLYVPKGAIPAYKAADQWKDFYYIGTTAIEAIEVSNIRIYPNPVKTELFIEGGELNLDNETASIYNLQGLEIINRRLEGDKSIHVSQLTPGVYILKIGAYTSKFIKE